MGKIKSTKLHLKLLVLIAAFCLLVSACLSKEDVREQNDESQVNNAKEKGEMKLPQKEGFVSDFAGVFDKKLNKN